MKRNNLRIAINANAITGPYGGANRFANNLEKGLREDGHYVTRSLETGLDVIFLISHNKRGLSSFMPEDIAEYRKFFPYTMIIQRINSCDEQRGHDLGTNKQILKSNVMADHVVFVSNFMRDFWLQRGIDGSRPHSTILTGADRTVFSPEGGEIWNKAEPFKLVTHHWSPNFLKGFDIYERLDEMVGKDPWKGKIEFTFIGNIPAGFTLHNANHLAPLDGDELAEMLRSHHGYVTAARFEPGGNHYIEAMQCGLPVLHLNHGSLPEYCGEYGTGFSVSSFEEKLLQFLEGYESNRQKVLNCKYSDTVMADKFVALTNRLASERASISRNANELRFFAYRFARKAADVRSRLLARLLS